jgi:hypothetical protein
MGHFYWIHTVKAYQYVPPPIISQPLKETIPSEHSLARILTVMRFLKRRGENKETFVDT